MLVSIPNSLEARSSATAEDLPEASFAGQQETFLNVRGVDSVLHHVRLVFASLYNDRAISYRVHHNFEHADVARDGQRILPDEEVLIGPEPVHGVARTDADDALVGLDAHDGHSERPTRLGVPSGHERRIERDAQWFEPDRTDAHEPAVSPTRSDAVLSPGP